MAGNMKTQRLNSGDIIPIGYFGDLHDDIRAGILSGDGRTCRVNRTPDGTTITVLRQPQTVGGAAAGGYTGPLKLVALIDSDAGTAQAKLIYGANPAESFCGYYMHGGTTETIPVVTSENLAFGTSSIYLKITVQTNGTLAYSLVTSNDAASQTAYQWIGNIVFDATKKTATVTQIHEGNLFLAGVV